jgi:hypothetical protein
MRQELMLALSTGMAIGQPARREVQETPPRVQYSAITNTETRLPEGMQPFIQTNRTGSLLVGDFLFGHRSELERMTARSLHCVKEVASALPVDQEDERIVDALVAKRTASLATRPLRRRDGEPR